MCLIGKLHTTHEPITKMISNQLDIQLEQFTQEELYSVLREIENRKAAGLDEIPPVLYSHDQLCKHICMQNHNDDTIKTSDTVLKKSIPLTLFERVRKGY